MGGKTITWEGTTFNDAPVGKRAKAVAKPAGKGGGIVVASLPSARLDRLIAMRDESSGLYACLSDETRREVDEYARTRVSMPA